MDFADRASALSDLYTANALAARAARSEAEVKESATECEDCGEAIPEARRKAVAGCARCTECQEIYDRSHA